MRSRIQIFSLVAALLAGACFRGKQDIPSGARPDPESDGWAANPELTYDFSIKNINATVNGTTVTITLPSIPE